MSDDPVDKMAVHCLEAVRERDAEIARLRAELETERMRLVACDTVAMADTPSSAPAARDMCPEYRSAALDSVIRRVDECMKLRAELDKCFCKSCLGTGRIDSDGFCGNCDLGRTKAELDAAKAVIEKLSPDALALAAEWERVEEMKGDFYGITYNPFLNSGAGSWVGSFYATMRLLSTHTGPTPAAAIIAAHEAWQKEQGK